MTTDLRALLTEVAEGRLAPDRAAELIAALPAEPVTTPVPPAAGAASGGAAAAGTDAVNRVRIAASARPVRVVGDPAVTSVTVDGPHSVRREGGTLRVEAGSPVGPAAAAQAGSYAYERKTGLSRWLSQATLVGVPMTVRINPALPVDIEVMAASLQVTGLLGPVDFSVTAGSVQLHDCSGPFTGVVRAGSARLEVRPTSGHSSVRVESGSIDLRLQPGSDVRVTGRADLGEIKVRGADGTTRVAQGEALKDVRVGSGASTFDLEVVMGSAKVRLP